MTTFNVINVYTDLGVPFICVCVCVCVLTVTFNNYSAIFITMVSRVAIASTMSIFIVLAHCSIIDLLCHVCSLTTRLISVLKWKFSTPGILSMPLGY